MYGYVVALRIKILRRVHYLYGVGQGEGGLYRQERVITDDVHSQAFGGVGYHGSDSSQTDDTQCLSLYLSAGELAFALFHSLAYVFSTCEGLCPLQTCRDISRGQEHS